jgi:hypothetical protein
VRAAANGRRKALIAIISVVVLLLALLFVFPSVEYGRSEAPPQPDATATNDMTATHAAVPAVDEAGPDIASTMSASEQVLPSPSSDHDNADESETNAAEGNSTPVADSIVDQKPDNKPGTVAAECWGLRGSAPYEVVTNDMATTAMDALHPPPPLNGIPVNPESLTRSPRNLEFDLEAKAGAMPCN